MKLVAATDAIESGRRGIVELLCDCFVFFASIATEDSQSRLASVPSNEIWRRIIP
jgi:hypothetical protein